MSFFTYDLFDLFRPIHKILLHVFLSFGFTVLVTGLLKMTRVVPSRCNWFVVFEMVIQSSLMYLCRSYISKGQHDFFPRRRITTNLVVFISNCHAVITAGAQSLRTNGVHGPAHVRMQSRLHMILFSPFTWEGQNLNPECTRKVCMLHSSGSKGKDKAKETQKSFLTTTHVL